MAADRMRAALALIFLTWLGLVLWRFRAVVSIEPVALLALLALTLFVVTVASLGAGAAVLRLLPGAPTGQSPELALVALAAGAGVLMGLAGLLGAVGLLRPWPLGAVLLAGMIAGALHLRRQVPGIGLTVSRGLRLPAIALVAVATVTLLAVPTASPFYDQLHYHLAFPFHWLRQGHLVTFPRHAYSFLPANGGLLYTYALASLGPWAAQALHWWLGVLATAAVALLGRTLGGPRAGVWAAAIFATTPAVMLTSTWASADLAMTAFAAVAWGMVVWPEKRLDVSKGVVWWLLTGVMVGVAAGCKISALLTVAVPMGVAALVAGGPATAKIRFRRALALTAGALLALSPWLVRNWQATGNPAYPFLTSVFTPAASASLQQEERPVAAFADPRQDVRLRLSLTTFSPRGAGGNIGPLYLGLVPLAVVVMTGRRRRLAGPLAVGVGVGLLGWWVGPPLGRYLLPVLAPLAALAGAGWARLLARSRPRLRALLQVPVGLALVWGVLSGSTATIVSRIGCTLGSASASELMKRSVSYWPAVEFVNQELPRDATVLLVGEARSLYLNRTVVVEDPFRTPWLVELADAARTPADMVESLRAEGVTHLLLNWVEARRIATMLARAEYFAPRTFAGEANLAGFFRQSVGTVFSQNGVVVLELRADQGGRAEEVPP